MTPQSTPVREREHRDARKAHPPSSGPLERRRILLRGLVQGVGFRPFAYRLASELGVRGWVANDPSGVVLECESSPEVLDRFAARLVADLPPGAFVRQIETAVLEPADFDGFGIEPSRNEGPIRTSILPDLATCRECTSEIFDPKAHRYRYPFTNCTHCGPRYTIIENLPYDRASTTLRGFEMCSTCRFEFENPGDRRFHAQPIACPTCGPQLAFWDATGRCRSQRDDALREAAAWIRDGAIVAVKGLGGFHLMCDARDEDVIRTLRTRKHREEKPLALMVPSLPVAAQLVDLSAEAAAILRSAAAPIVLLPARSQAKFGAMRRILTSTLRETRRIEGRLRTLDHRLRWSTETASDDAAQLALARSVAPGNPNLGVMLPSTPLHHLLLAELGFPVVATSGNRSDEPICIDEQEALARLSGIADFFLVHDRPIARAVDDSVVRVVDGRLQVLRRARGYTPLPLNLRGDTIAQGPDVLALGPHLKNTIAVARQDEVTLSQHLGDLDTELSLQGLDRSIRDLTTLTDVTPRIVVCDAHPDYASTLVAEELARSGSADPPRLVRVPHHLAHVLAVIAEHGLEAPVLGIAWDGAGLGPDGTIWGGEFLRVDAENWRRIARVRPFPLPGGDQAAREPRRAALGLLHAAIGETAFSLDELADANFTKQESDVLRTMLFRNLQSPLCSSVGRLFDAWSSLLGIRQISSFEGQAAMELEHLAHRAWKHLSSDHSVRPYGLKIENGEVDWRPWLEEMLEERRILRARDASVQSLALLAARFHRTWIEVIAEVARRADLPRVVLSGGCFQNRLLLEGAITRLRSDGFQVWWPEQVPPNDGGIALGQVAAARLDLSYAGDDCVRDGSREALS